MILAINSFAQVQQEWVARYNGGNNLNYGGSDIEIDKHRNIIVLGTANTLLLNKYDSLGSLVWTKPFPQAYITRIGKCLALDDSDNIYINGVGQGNYADIFTAKYNSIGELMWVSSYSSIGYSSDWTVKISVGKDGFVYVLGNSSPVQYDNKYLLIKYNPITGDSVWTRIFDEAGGTGPFDMELDNESNIYITGSSNGIKTIKYDSSGFLKWVSISQAGEPHAIGIDKFKNVYVTAEIYQYTGFDCKTIKYDSNGTILWVKIYDSFANHYDVPYSLAVDDSANVFIAGTSEDNSYNDEYLVVKYNPSGIQQWVSRFVGVAYHNDWLRKIILDKNGNCYITGYTCYNGVNSRRCTIVKYSNDGVLSWVQHYNSYNNGTDVSNDITLDSLGNVYIVGNGYRINSPYSDIISIKYKQFPIGVSSISSEIPSHFSLHQNYPNPFNPSTKIKFQIPLLRGVSGEAGRGVFTSLKIFDILGREVRLLVNENLKPGIYEADFNAADLPSGVYFYKLNAGEFVDTKKMILLK